MFDVAPMTGTIGAEILNIDIAADLDDETIAKLTEALVDHKVIFFRDQHNLTDERQVAFARRFGEIQCHPFLPHVDGVPEVSIISSPEALRSSPALSHETNWHSDVTFAKRPPLGSILRAVDIPSYGRDTMWCDMEAVFADFSEPMKELLRGLTATHDWRTQFRSAAAVLSTRKEGHYGEMTDKMDKADTDIPPSVHPVVRTHPVSGRQALFVNSSFTSKINELRRDEGRALMDFLLGQTRFPEYQVRFRWQPGSVAFWDNRSAQHFIINDRSYARIMHRVTIQGDEPR